jgi:hypothetical protein
LVNIQVRLAESYICKLLESSTPAQFVNLIYRAVARFETLARNPMPMWEGLMGLDAVCAIWQKISPASTGKQDSGEKPRIYSSTNGRDDEGRG